MLYISKERICEFEEGGEGRTRQNTKYLTSLVIHLTEQPDEGYTRKCLHIFCFQTYCRRVYLFHFCFPADFDTVLS